MSARGRAHVLQVLPLHVRHGAEMVGDWRAHPPQGSEGFLSRGNIAAPAEWSDHYGPSVPGCVKERQRRRVYEDDHTAESVRRLHREIAECPQYECRLLGRPND